MSTVLGFPDATSPTPQTGTLWLTEGSGSTRDKKVQAGTLVTDLLGCAVNSQAAASPIVGATDLLPVARGNTGGKASVDAVVGAGFPGALPTAVAAMSSASALVGTETLALVQTTAKKIALSKIVAGMRSFSQLSELIPVAIPTNPTSIKAQYRMTSHVGLGDKVLYADLSFHWSATYAASGSCGWTIPNDLGTLAGDTDSALRELWGIGPSDEWTFPYLNGTFIVPGGVYPFTIWNAGGSPLNSQYKIYNWTATEKATLYSFGQITVHVPGTR